LGRASTLTRGKALDQSVEEKIQSSWATLVVTPSIFSIARVQFHQTPSIDLVIKAISKFLVNSPIVLVRGYPT
jgi:hypothetical protein